MSTTEKANQKLPTILEKKIKGIHQERLAIVYIRQSSLNQVENNRESTQLQYGLVNRAIALGWPKERVVVIDDDLGVSGATAEGRVGFQRLLSEIALNHVGMILGVEMSRLARSCKDWYQLLELCGLFNTLICDLDGVYDPSIFNDRLLLGLKGTMSEAELHVIRQRMWQGALQKAKRGELLGKGPMGYLRSENTLILDPDEQAQGVIRLVFDRFERMGSMHAVLRSFVAEDIKLPVRSASKINQGELEWRRPNSTAIKTILSHPTYAGAYVFGRSRQNQKAKQQKLSYLVPRDQWLVLLRDRFPAYITWERYEENQNRLQQNRSLCSTRGSVRKGRALLGGLVVCGRCGYRLRTQYGGATAKPSYRCSAKMSLYGEAGCQAVKAKSLDDEVVRLAMLAMQPAALEVSLRVTEDVRKQQKDTEKLWSQRLERAAYEAERAARQYHAVDPENRLVARTLELAWEEKLKAQRELQEQQERFHLEKPRVLSAEDQLQVQQLAENLPALWNAESTTNADRKTILREIVDHVEVNIEGDSEWVEAWIHWAGGNRTYTRFQRPIASTSRLSNAKQLIGRVKELLDDHVSAPKIAKHLNQEGFKTARGKPFDTSRVRMLMSREGLRSKRNKQIQKAKLKKNQWYIMDLVKEAGVGYGKIHRWIKSGRLDAKKDDSGHWIVTADKAKREELAKIQHPGRKRFKEVCEEELKRQPESEA